MRCTELAGNSIASCLSEPLHLCITLLHSRNSIKLTTRDSQDLDRYESTYLDIVRQRSMRYRLRNLLHSKRASGNVESSNAKVGAPAKEEELPDLNRTLSILELALAPHQDSDKCLVCRTVRSIKESIKPWPAVNAFNKHMFLLKAASSSDQDMILKHHEPSLFVRTRKIGMRRVHKVDLVLATIGDLLAWKLREYDVALKDPTAHTWRRENHTGPSVNPNVCNARSPRGQCLRFIHLHRDFSFSRTALSVKEVPLMRS